MLKHLGIILNKRGSLIDHYKQMKLKIMLNTTKIEKLVRLLIIANKAHHGVMEIIYSSIF